MNANALLTGFRQQISGRPVINLATGLLAGRYVSRLPWKAVVPVTLAAMAVDWTLQRKSLSPTQRHLQQLAVTIILSGAFVAVFPSFRKRLPDILGLWALISSVHAAVHWARGLGPAKALQTAPPAPETESTPQEAVASATMLCLSIAEPAASELGEQELLAQAAAIFSKYFAAEPGFSSLRDAKDTLSEVCGKAVAIGSFENRSVLLTLERVGDEPWRLEATYAEGYDGPAIQLSPAALITVVVPSPSYVVAALKKAADRLNAEQAREWTTQEEPAYIKRSLLLQTEDGRSWSIVWTKSGMYVAIQLDSTGKVSDEVVCMWPRESDEPMIKIDRGLFDYLNQAFERALQQDQ